ncbi:MAG: isocyanide synthase family protein [Candidatus Thiodiazotropha sp. (ex Rostrolucina anterorostrata)]|nr:isocyanide synthase family protein [Candidatus Thiodiazotropha sp. (ex Rostrolucina anterorostrata)]
MIANHILDIIFKRRRLLDDEAGPGTDSSIEDLPPEETDIHLNKIQKMMDTGEPISMILPAFPGKSPNRNKTLSRLPDLAETHSIDSLYSLCRDINEIYKPGAKIIICSDGYVFSDLVRIPDEDVELYSLALIDYYNESYPGAFEFYDLKDTFPQLDSMDAMREELMIRYGESLICLKARAKEHKEVTTMYLGITRFLYEDFAGLDEFRNISRAQIQKMAKSVSYRVIQRSNAWGTLLEEIYPDSLRLSIHPQYRVSNKIGIHMISTDDCWRTPWHSVAVKKNGMIYLENRSNINENRSRLLFENGRPHYYQEEA